MSKKRVVGDKKFGKRGKFAVATDPVFQLVATRLGEGTQELTRMLQGLSRENRAMVSAVALAAMHAFAQISGTCVLIDRSHDVYDKAMKRKKPAPMPRQRGKGKWKR